jgi:hypothetical protein
LDTFIHNGVGRKEEAVRNPISGSAPTPAFLKLTALKSSGPGRGHPLTSRRAVSVSRVCTGRLADNIHGRASADGSAACRNAMTEGYMILICRLASGRTEAATPARGGEAVERSVSSCLRPAACKKIERLLVKAKHAAVAVVIAPVLLKEFIVPLALR